MKYLKLICYIIGHKKGFYDGTTFCTRCNEKLSEVDIHKNINKRFPRKIEKYWGCASIFGENYKNCQIATKYRQWEEKEIVPLLYKDGYLAFYKITGYSQYGSGMGDYAGWDDRLQWNMIYVNKKKILVDFDKNKINIKIGKEEISIPKNYLKKLNNRYTNKDSNYYIEPLLQALYCIKHIDTNIKKSGIRFLI